MVRKAGEGVPALPMTIDEVVVLGDEMLQGFGAAVGTFNAAIREENERRAADRRAFETAEVEYEGIVLTPGEVYDLRTGRSTKLGCLFVGQRNYENNKPYLSFLRYGANGNSFPLGVQIPLYSDFRSWRPGYKVTVTKLSDATVERIKHAYAGRAKRLGSGEATPVFG